MPPDPNFLKNSDWLDISEDDYAWLDFTIEKTHDALYDAGKKFEKLFISFLALLSLAAILAYGHAAFTGTEEFKVPFLELSLDRRYAAILIEFLATCAFSSLVLAGIYEEILRWRLEGLLLVRYGELSKLGDTAPVSLWYLLYPSLFRISLFLKTYRPSNFVIPVLYILIGLAGLLFPAVLGWNVGTDLAWTRPHKLELCAALLVLPALIVILGVNLFPRSQAAAEIFETLTKHFRKN